jgi:hypothetical protein
MGQQKKGLAGGAPMTQYDVAVMLAKITEKHGLSPLDRDLVRRFLEAYRLFDNAPDDTTIGQLQGRIHEVLWGELEPIDEEGGHA